MKIKNIKINSYGTLKNKEINLKNNLNIIYGKNESGKSTLLNYIKNIFYGISKNKNGKEISDYEKYTPWIGEEFSGKIEYQLDNKKTFEVYRDFNKKNAKIFNDNLEDISDQFKIDKKDGNQFFYDQTGVDEKTYTSTIMSTQQEVVLDIQSQNMLVQKIANLAGTGDDKISFKKAIEKLNKRQIEEVGTSRSQDRPINLIQKRMKEIEFVLKDEELRLESRMNLDENKREISDNLREEKNKNNAIRQLNMLTQQDQINLEKIKLKTKIKNENLEKIKKLDEEKNKLLKNNLDISEKLEKNNIKNNNLNNNLENKKIKNNYSEKNKLNKKIKINNLIFSIIFILLILINIVNFKFISNKIINYILLILIPIELIIFLIYYLKNKNKIKKLEKQLLEKDLQEKLEAQMQRQKLNEQISIIDNQVNLLKDEIKKQEKEISEEQLQVEKNRQDIINKINQENSNINIYSITNLKTIEEVQKELEKSNEKITNYQIQINRIEYEEKEISEKIEEIVSLKEEYEILKEQLQILEEKDKCFNATKELLQKAYDTMRKNVTPKFTQNLSELIEKITNGKYKKVSINEENGLVVELENGEYTSARVIKYWNNRPIIFIFKTINA